MERTKRVAIERYGKATALLAFQADRYNLLSKLKNDMPNDVLSFSLLKEILNTQEVKEVLDIGGGKGLHALLCASYGAKVDIIDPDDTDGYQYLDFLKGSHPLIKHHKVMAHQFEFSKDYDLILLLNVIPFMKKNFVLDKLLPNLGKHLKPSSDWSASTPYTIHGVRAQALSYLYKCSSTVEFPWKQTQN